MVDETQTTREHPISIAEVRAALGEVVRVMKEIPSVWNTREPASTGVEAQLSGRTTVEQYLRWGKVPDVEGICEHDGPWPKESTAGLRIAGTLSTHSHLAPLRDPFERLDRLLAGNGDPARYHYLRALEAFQSSDFDTCIAAATDASVIRPDFPNAEHLAGWALLKKKDAAGAVPHLERAVSLAPAETDPIIHLCDALVACSKGSEAKARMLDAVTAKATARHAHNWLGYYFTRYDRNLARAIEHLEKSLDANSSWGTAWLNYAWALELSGRREDAFVAYACALLARDSYDPAWAEERKIELGATFKAEGKAPFDPAEWLGCATTFRFVNAVRAVVEGRADASVLAAIQSSSDVRYGGAAEPLEKVADRLHGEGKIELAVTMMTASCAAYDVTAQGLVHEAEGERARDDAERARKKLEKLKRTTA